MVVGSCPPFLPALAAAALLLHGTVPTGRLAEGVAATAAAGTLIPQRMH